MNPEAQAIFDKILAKLKREESLLPHEAAFLRARRSYLTRWQRLKYGDILYLNKQFIFLKIRNAALYMAKFTKEIVLALLVGLVILLISRYLGWNN